MASSDVVPQTQKRYQRYIKSFDGAPVVVIPLHWPGLNADAVAAFGPTRAGFLAADRGRARDVLDSAPSHWVELDSTEVEFPEDYPPLPPAFHAADVPTLTCALTHVFCRLHFGPQVVFDQRYTWLGVRLCRAAISLVATATLQAASSAELDVRFGLGCYGCGLNII